jgi:membrane protein
VPADGGLVVLCDSLALPQLLLLLLAAVGLFVDPQDFQGRIVAEVHGLLGAEGARMIGEIITSANRPGSGTLAIPGVVMMLIGATARSCSCRAHSTPAGAYNPIRSRAASRP